MDGAVLIGRKVVDVVGVTGKEGVNVVCGNVLVLENVLGVAVRVNVDVVGVTVRVLVNEPGVNVRVLVNVPDVTGRKVVNGVIMNGGTLFPKRGAVKVRNR
jgi:hypothetical protein